MNCRGRGERRGLVLSLLAIHALKSLAIIEQPPSGFKGT
jgi:hypothetical protein